MPRETLPPADTRIIEGVIEVSAPLVFTDYAASDGSMRHINPNDARRGGFASLSYDLDGNFRGGVYG